MLPFRFGVRPAKRGDDDLHGPLGGGHVHGGRDWSSSQTALTCPGRGRFATVFRCAAAVVPCWPPLLLHCILYTHTRVYNTVPSYRRRFRNKLYTTVGPACEHTPRHLRNYTPTRRAAVSVFSFSPGYYYYFLIFIIF